MVRRRAPLAGAGLIGGGELAALELADGRVEGAVEHPRQLPRGDLVAQQRLQVSQLVVRGLFEGDLEREALACERRDLGSLGLNTPRGVLIDRPGATRRLGGQGRG